MIRLQPARRERPAAKRGERGVVLVVVAVMSVVLVMIVALVIDLGAARQRRRSEQSAVDIAALASGYQLSGHGNRFVLSDPRAACTAAFNSIKKNLPEIPSASTLPCTNLPITGESPDCTDSTAMTTVTSAGASPYTVKVDYPVPADQITDSRFSTGVGAGDGVQCTRMRVSVTSLKPTFFAGVFGSGQFTVKASAVVKGSVDATHNGVPALLMLERTGCQVLTNSVGGAGNLGIIVRSVTSQEGGHAHVDTDASECGGNSSDYAIYATPLSGGGTSMSVVNGTATAGTITSYATTVGSARGGATYPGGLSMPVTAGPLVSRYAFDARYNPSTLPSVTNLHAAAYSAVNMTTAQAVTAGYTVVDCTADGSITGVKVFVNCPGVYSPTAAFFNQATDVVFNGQVSVGSGHTLNLFNANSVSIKGCAACTGSSYYSLNVSGGFYTNIGSQNVSSATCASRTGPGAGGTNTNTTVLALMNAPLVIAGQARLCQTTVYMGANSSSYTRQATTTGGSVNSPCSIALPCPIKTGAAPGGSYAISGDSTEWTAPNLSSNSPDESSPFEDLGLWSESSDLDQIKSGGVLSSGGIFFTPNSPVQFRSPASSSPKNAQFVARTLQLLQGTMDMEPVSSDAVPVPLAGQYGLIR
ncbi:MAG: hypothetical protein JWM05_1080 [Acidimicrobiales bacterium]|nr:hypothetical protein [Acidimicrobiales bacterium]